MGSGGTEFESNDTFDTDRLNQKTTFVGKSSQATNLILNPQAGQMVYSTEQTDVTFPPVQNDVFPLDHIVIRNAANDTWQSRHMTETSETTEGDVPTEATNALKNNRIYRFLTLPTTEKFYIIHKIEGYVGNNDGTTETVTWQFGVDIVNADPPTIDSTTLVGISPEYSQSVGASTSIAVTCDLITDPIRGGTVIGVWGTVTDTGLSSTLIGELSGQPSQNTRKNIGSFADDFAENTSWTAETDYLKARISYYGYS